MNRASNGLLIMGALVAVVGVVLGVMVVASGGVSDPAPSLGFASVASALVLVGIALKATHKRRTGRLHH